jgi:hypothetical protein
MLMPFIISGHMGLAWCVLYHRWYANNIDVLLPLPTFVNVTHASSPVVAALSPTAPAGLHSPRASRRLGWASGTGWQCWQSHPRS